MSNMNLPVQQPTDQSTLISVANHLILYILFAKFSKLFLRETVFVSKKLQLVLLFQERLDVIVWLVMHIQGVNCRSVLFNLSIKKIIPEIDDWEILLILFLYRYQPSEIIIGIN